jgi:hypothetical protein
MNNHRIFKVRFLAPTNHRNPKVILTEVRRRKGGVREQTDRKAIFWTHESPSQVKDLALEYFQSIGINCCGYASIGNDYYIFSDSWQDGNGFITITGEVEYP